MASGLYWHTYNSNALWAMKQILPASISVMIVYLVSCYEQLSDSTLKIPEQNEIQ